MRALQPFTKRSLPLLAALGLVLLAVFFSSSGTVSAAAPAPLPTPEGPDRFTSMVVDITLHEWWLTAWKDNSVACSFFVDHEGLPNYTDIFSACGQDLYNEWVAYSTPCNAQDITACPGYYFLEVSSKPSTRDVTVKLPPPQVWVSLEDCELDSDGWCITPPSLVLTGDEPLPNESITAISGTVGSDSFTCSENPCKFKLDATRPEGIRLKFWAYSTHGDSSQVFDALVRVLGDQNDQRLTPRWYVNVISQQWQGPPVASCSAAWESFPPPGDLPQWLTTPQTSSDLYSNIPYAYLAANLISEGAVDVSNCSDDGLLPDGSASACGMDSAAGAVSEWQNRFDNLIFSVAQASSVPAQLLKNLFSRESQFWPGVIHNGQDVGLGQMTEGGADTTLLWNPSFYQQFCPLVLDQSVCEANGFANLTPERQNLLRGALVSSVDARCADCPLGLDLSRANFSVDVFARTMLANCEQAGHIVADVTGKEPGLTVDYETMWRFTLVNYNAGSGCLAIAVNQAYNPAAETPLGWDGVAGILDQACPGSVGYVNDISQGIESQPPATSP